MHLIPYPLGKGEDHYHACIMYPRVGWLVQLVREYLSWSVDSKKSIITNMLLLQKRKAPQPMIVSMHELHTLKFLHKRATFHKETITIKSIKVRRGPMGGETCLCSFY